VTAGACIVVLGQERHARKRLVAAGAAVSLDAGVRLQVRAQVRPVGERALAVRARVRPLAGVRAQVPLQQPRTRERLAAERAAARQRVSPDVHLERSLSTVHLHIDNTHQYSHTLEEVSAVAKLTRATKSCCGQSLTISATNYSGRASELGGIINDDGPVFHDWGVYLSSAKSIARSTILYAVPKFPKSGI